MLINKKLKPLLMTDTQWAAVQLLMPTEIWKANSIDPKIPRSKLISNQEYFSHTFVDFFTNRNSAYAVLFYIYNNELYFVYVAKMKDTGIL